MLFAKANRFITKMLPVALSLSLFISGCTKNNTVQTSLSEEDNTTIKYSEEEIQQEREAFDLFVYDCFVELVSRDTLTLHQFLEYPEKYGITDPEVTFGHSADEDIFDFNNLPNATTSRLDDVLSLRSNNTVTDRFTVNASVSYAEDFSAGFNSSVLNNKADLAEYDMSWEEAALRELRGYDRDCLTDEQMLTYDVFEDALELSVEGEKYRLYSEPLSVSSGEQTMLPVVLSEYRFQRIEDIDTYLALLETLPDYISSILRFEEEKSEAGFFMADYAADEVIENCRSFTQDSDDHIMIVSFDNRISELEWLTAEEREAYSLRNADIVRSIFIPQYELLSSGIEALKGTGKNEKGICGLEGGKEYMAHLCRELTGTDYTPEQMIDLLLDEVKSSTAEIYRIIGRNPQLIEELDRFSFGVDTPEEILEDLREKSKAEFPTPAASDYSVSYIPEFLEPFTAQAFYLLPPLDTVTTNRIYVNSAQISDVTELYTVMAHEGYPGHMLQQLYYMEKDAPPLRSLFSYLGYMEGWAQYIAYKSYEFNTEASADLITAMQLNEIINYDVSAICDLYVNYSGYTEEQLADYLSENGFSDAGIDKLYRSLACNPGLYLPYAVGTYEVRQLRAHAENELGDLFSPLEFHRHLLDIGQGPFRIVWREMDKWIASVING